jgi:hypothetical protein
VSELAGAAPLARSRGRLWAKILVIAVIAGFAGALSHPAVQTRLRVHWHAWHLDSRDPMVRTKARQALLDMGRPAIDPVFPDLVAGEVEDELTGVSHRLVIVGVRERIAPKPGVKPLTGWVSFYVERLLETDDVHLADLFQKPGTRVTVRDTIVCPTAQRLVRDDARRELVVAADVQDFPKAALRVAVPVDDDEVGLAVIDAVRERILRKP